MTDNKKWSKSALKKGGFNFSYDGTSDCEKGSTVNKSKEKCTS